MPAEYRTCKQCNKNYHVQYGTEDGFCGSSCRDNYQKELRQRQGPVIINNSGSGSSGSLSGLLDAGIDIVTGIHEAKKAKKEAEEAAERRRLEERRSTPEYKENSRQFEEEEKRIKSISSADAWLNEIEQMANEAIKKIEGTKFSGETKNRTQYLAEAKTKIANAVTKAKSEVEKYWPVMDKTSTAARNAKLEAEYKIKKARIDLKANMSHIDYWFFKKNSPSEFSLLISLITGLFKKRR